MLAANCCISVVDMPPPPPPAPSAAPLSNESPLLKDDPESLKEVEGVSSLSLDDENQPMM